MANTIAMPTASLATGALSGISLKPINTCGPLLLTLALLLATISTALASLVATAMAAV